MGTMYDLTDVLSWVLCMTSSTISHGHCGWRCTVFLMGTMCDVPDILSHYPTSYLVVFFLDFRLFYPTRQSFFFRTLLLCYQEEYRDKYPDGESNSPYVFICENPQVNVIEEKPLKKIIRIFITYHFEHELANLITEQEEKTSCGLQKYIFKYVSC